MYRGDGQAKIPGPWTCNGESPTSKPTAAMSWYVQLMAGSRSETLTTGNIRRQSAAVNQL